MLAKQRALPNVDPKPSVRFLIESGGQAAYWEARSTNPRLRTQLARHRPSRRRRTVGFPRNRQTIDLHFYSYCDIKKSSPEDGRAKKRLSPKRKPFLWKSIIKTKRWYPIRALLSQIDRRVVAVVDVLDRHRRVSNPPARPIGSRVWRRSSANKPRRARADRPGEGRIRFSTAVGTGAATGKDARAAEFGSSGDRQGRGGLARLARSRTRRGSLGRRESRLEFVDDRAGGLGAGSPYEDLGIVGSPSLDQTRQGQGQRSAAQGRSRRA